MPSESLQLAQNVKMLTEETRTQEERAQQLKDKISQYESELQRGMLPNRMDLLFRLSDSAYKAISEIKSYTSGNPKQKSVRDILTRKITEAEHLTRQLHEQQQATKLTLEENTKQLEMLTEVRKLLKLKYLHNKVLMKTEPEAKNTVVIPLAF